MGLGQMVTQVVGSKAAIKSKAMAMGGGALTGVGFAFLSRWSWLNTPLKRGAAAALIGLAGEKIARKFGGAQLADGIPGACGAIIGMEILRAVNGGGGAVADAGYESAGYPLMDPAVEERRLSAGGSFADADVDENPRLNGVLSSIVGA